MVKRLRINIPSLMRTIEFFVKVMVNTQIVSKYRSVYRGKGLEFEDFRVYDPNMDDAIRIDWKASSRANDLLVRVYKEERELDVYILLDVSSSMIFGSTKKLKMEYAAELAASLAYLVLNAGDRVGLIMFNERIVSMIPPSMGKNQLFFILNELTKPENYGGGFNLPNALNFVMKTSSRRGLVIIISDFIGMGNEVKDYLRRLSLKFDVIAFMIRDPRDEKMPDENLQVVVEDPFSHRSLTISTLTIKNEYEEFVKNNEENIKEIFLKSNCDITKVSTQEHFIKPVLKFFLIRRERLWT